MTGYRLMTFDGKHQFGPFDNETKTRAEAYRLVMRTKAPIKMFKDGMYVRLFKLDDSESRPYVISISTTSGNSYRVKSNGAIYDTWKSIENAQDRQAKNRIAKLMMTYGKPRI